VGSTRQAQDQRTAEKWPSESIEVLCFTVFEACAGMGEAELIEYAVNMFPPKND